MSAGRLTAVLLALTLGACAGDPDLPRSYPQPGLFGGAHHESRRREAARPPATVYGAPVLPGGPPQVYYQPQAQPAYPRPSAPQYAPQPAPAPQYPPQYQPPAQAAYPPVRAPDPYPGVAYPQPQPPYAAPASPPARWGGAYADWTEEDYRYRLGPGDELALRFLINPDLNGQVIIGPDGRGIFPLVSGVKVADLTVDQANQALTQAYAQVLRAPQVEVLINSYGSAQVFVGGEVKEPGVKPVKGQLTPAQAVMTAGGALPTARTGRVVVIRQRPGGRILMKDIDLKAYLAGGGATGDGFAVLPGDLVFVPRSKISEVDLFVEQYIKGVLPFSPSFGYSINRGRTY
ncbi:polysaccharide biosynthesis/export family protein [Phenylobacterium aquaticum]|uniref:polysaccharide biosynthesis/export family protein n=1 Tax=Phenylobacterium aquaticum TaxID=1763816 RepID=UPI0026F12FB8|nr:polysaccharide biosynthesis/export family protein [Phenylobacterium aquaticum]